MSFHWGSRSLGFFFTKHEGVLSGGAFIRVQKRVCFYLVDEVFDSVAGFGICS